MVERWSGGGRREDYPDIARKVVRARPDVIFAASGRLAQAFRPVTTTIPIGPGNRVALFDQRGRLLRAAVVC